MDCPRSRSSEPFRSDQDSRPLAGDVVHLPINIGEIPEMSELVSEEAGIDKSRFIAMVVEHETPKGTHLP